MSDRCHTVDGIHIPGCMGCAVSGHHACTCEPADSLSALTRRLARLEERVAQLEPPAAHASARRTPSPGGAQNA